MPESTATGTGLQPGEQRQDATPVAVAAEADATGGAVDAPPTAAVAGARAQPGPRPRVRELLAAYDRALAAVDELPPLVPIRTRHQRPKLWRPLPALPRPKLLLRTMIAQHVRHTLHTLERCYHRRAAFGATDDHDEADQAALQHYRAALPVVHRNTMVTVVLLFVLITSKLLLPPALELADLVVEAGAGAEACPKAPDEEVIDTAAAAPDSPPASASRDPVATVLCALQLSELPGLVDSALGAATFEYATLGALLTQLLEAGPLVLALLASYLALVFYLVLRPVAGAFRLKRILFNLDPEPQAFLKTTTAAWHTPQATGVYTAEADLLDELGWDGPAGEQPFDLVVLALPPIVLLGPAVVVAALGGAAYGTTIPGERGYGLGLLIAGLLAVVAVGPCLARLQWLRAVRRGRQHLQATPPRELALPGSGRMVLLRRPGVLALAAAAPYLLLVLVVLEDAALFRLRWGEIALVAAPALGLTLACTTPWWYRVCRELRDLGRARDVPLGRWPAAVVPLLLLAAVLLTAAGGAFFVAGLAVGALPVVTLRRRVARAQWRAGQPVTVWPGWLLAPAVLALPLLLWHLQRELNLVWRQVGEAPVEAPTQPAGRPAQPPARRQPGRRRAALGAALVFAGAVLLIIEPAPDQLGDDRTLDRLLRRCDRGDQAACAELYFESAVGSGYERFAAERVDWDALD